MPYKRGYKKRARRNFRKAGKGGRRYYAKKYNNVGTLIADTTKIHMKYAEDVIVNVNGTLGSDYLFRCNSIFDPNQSGAGHQPMGHDEYARFYKRYVVVGSKITVRFVGATVSGSTVDPNAITNVGITTIDDTGSNILLPSEFMENNRTTYGVIQPQRPSHTITKYFSAKEFFGVKNAVDDDTLFAGFGQNPQNGALWQLKFWPDQAGASDRRVSINVMIQYICVLRERQPIGGS